MTSEEAILNNRSLKHNYTHGIKKLNFWFSCAQNLHTKYELYKDNY